MGWVAMLHRVHEKLVNSCPDHISYHFLSKSFINDTHFLSIVHNLKLRHFLLHSCIMILVVYLFFLIEFCNFLFCVAFSLHGKGAQIYIGYNFFFFCISVINMHLQTKFLYNRCIKERLKGLRQTDRTWKYYKNHIQRERHVFLQTDMTKF